MTKTDDNVTYELEESGRQSRSPKAQAYAERLARELRDLMDNQISAHALAKYYEIDDLKEAIEAVRDGKKVILI